ncbi:MAG: PAS domain S-box protein [Gammaproteobacteria bacterium]|nr:PAS domain S-box protein [Gammaproteobacteria bacterium]
MTTTAQTIASPIRLRQRLLLPLALLLIGTSLLFATSSWWMEKGHLQAGFDRDLHNLKQDLSSEVLHHSALLAAAASLLRTSPPLIAALHGDDRAMLKQWGESAQQRLQLDHQVDELVLLDAHGNILVHRCPHRMEGDAEAHRSRMVERVLAGEGTVSGLELGHCGMLATRIALPVESEGELLGVLSLGQGIQGHAAHLEELFDFEAYLLVDKREVDPEIFARNMAMTGQPAEWDRLPDRLITYRGRDPIPPELLQRLATASSYAGDHEESYRDQRLAILPIDDANGQRVGEAVLLRDISGHLRNNLIAIGQVVGVGLLGSLVLFGFGYRLLGRAEVTMTQEQIALEDSEKRYRRLYEFAPNAYFTIRATDGAIVNCNKAAEDLLGYDRQTLKQLKVFELYADTPDGKPQAAELFTRFNRGEPWRDEELQMQRKDGTPVWVSLSVKPVQDRKGRISESLSMVIDITQRKETEKALREQLDELREFQRLTVGRELRMEEIEQENVALKARIDELENR